MSLRKVKYQNCTTVKRPQQKIVIILRIPHLFTFQTLMSKISPSFMLLFHWQDFDFYFYKSHILRLYVLACVLNLEQFLHLTRFGNFWIQIQVKLLLCILMCFTTRVDKMPLNYKAIRCTVHTLECIYFQGSQWNFK